MKIAEMIMVCNYFLKNCRPILESHPLLLPLPPYIEEVLQELEKSRSSLPSLDPEKEKEIRNRLDELDDLHDTFNNALYSFLGALATKFRHTDPQKSQKIINLRQILFPMKLQVNTLTWFAEAGESSRLHEQLLDESIQQQLSAMTVYDQTALDWAEDIVKIGAEMQELLLQLYPEAPPTDDNDEDEDAVPSQLAARRRFYQMIRLLRESADVALANQTQQQKTLWASLNQFLEQEST